MDNIRTVEGVLSSVVSKFDAYASKYAALLTQERNNLDEIRNELFSDMKADDEVNIHTVIILEKAIEKIRNYCANIGQEHREIHSLVSKCGREIDKSFTQDIGSVCPKEIHYEDDADRRQKVDAIVAQHLVTVGMFDVAESLSRESGVPIDEKCKREFMGMNGIFESLKRRDYEPALEWAANNGEALRHLGSNVEFALHKAKFLQLITTPDPDIERVLEYAKNLGRFADGHTPEIQQLMGALMYMPLGLTNSPYAHLLDPGHHHDLIAAVANDACALVGLPVKSYLSVILNAGVKALPSLLNIRQVMVQRHVEGIWSHSEELPVEVDLGNEYRFHSIFSCPILRQQTTQNNPPMRLTCGHVISKDALNKLSSSSNVGGTVDHLGNHIALFQKRRK